MNGERAKGGGTRRVTTTALWQTQAVTWPEAEVIAQPVARAEKPLVLVRRRTCDLEDGRGREVVFCEGYPAISLFTGCGGFDIGSEAAGFTTLVQHEWSGACCATLIGNRPRFFRHAALIQGDIRATPTTMLLREAGLRVGEAYLLTGGPPCQGFTTANRHAQQGRYDSRNDLIYEFLRVVREAQPRYFMMENVPGFVNFNGGEYFRAFLPAAYACFYELVYGLVDAVEYGVPQYRCRFFCAGTRRDVADIEGAIASLLAPHTFAERDLSLIQAMDGAPLFTAEQRLLMHPPGVRYFPDRPVLIPPHPVSHGGEGRTEKFVEFFRRLEREEPDRIVTGGRRV